MDDLELAWQTYEFHGEEIHKFEELYLSNLKKFKIFFIAFKVNADDGGFPIWTHQKVFINWAFKELFLRQLSIHSWCFQGPNISG